jgi:pyruvate,water dikinase
MVKARKFSDPHDFMDLPGTEGWREMYPYDLQFHNEEPARSYESSKFWFIDSLHNPTPMTPFEAIPWIAMVGEYPNARALCVPGSYSLDRRILNGYNYCAGSPVTDPQLIEKRSKIFAERISFTLTNWDVLYGVLWHRRIVDLINELKKIQIPEHLSEVEDISAIKEARGDSEGLILAETYSKMINLYYRMWSYHQWFNTVAYFVYISRSQAIKKLFPGIGDKSLTKMFQGFEAAIFQPPMELRKLAKSAVGSGVADDILNSSKWDDVMSKLRQTDAGRKWLQEFEGVREPWFEMSIGTGFYGMTDIAWNDDLNIPLNHLKKYIEGLKKGVSIERSMEGLIEERDRVTAEYRSLIKSDEDRAAFESLIQITRKVAPYAEDHNWYCENWFTSIFFRKVREIGQLAVNHGILENKDDIWYVNPMEVCTLINDLRHGWYTGTQPIGKSYWPPKVERRKKIMEIFRKWTPEPAFGPAPSEVTEATLIGLYGITTEAVNRWLEARELKPEETKSLTGFAGSGGVIEGRARVCFDPSDISSLKPGDILVAPTTSPTWAPVFQIIKGVVVDVGGIFSHAAIVAREYDIPAVIGVGMGTKVINTGDIIKVDGDTGVVSIIERSHK